MTEPSPPGLIYAFRLSLRFEEPLIYQTMAGQRRFLRFHSAEAEGPELTASLADNGGDWLLMRRDGVADLEGRMMLRATSGEHIYWRSRGTLRFSADGSSGSYALQPWFDTNLGPHDPMTKTAYLATGQWSAEGAELDVWRLA